MHILYRFGVLLFVFNLLSACSGSSTPEVIITASMQSATANSKHVATTRDTAILITLKDDDGGYFFKILGQTANGTLIGPLSGSEIIVTYTPVPSFSGNDSFDFEVTDADGNVSTGTVTIQVLATSNPPATANSQTVATTRNTAITITLKDDNGDTGYRFKILGQTANGTLVGPLSGSEITVTYTPVPSFSGNDSFDFEVTDVDGNTSSATITIIVLDTINPELDSDGDGLTDVHEINLYKTNPNIADSDGDSLSDWREVVDLAFNPANDNYRFNPLIADVPKLRLQITSAPDITLNYVTTDGTSETVSTQRSQSSSSAVSTSTTDTRSTAVEETHTVGGEVTAGTSGVDGTVSYSASFSTSSESSHSWSKEQTQENTTAASKGTAIEQNNAIATSSGNLRISLKVSNDSVVPFTLKSLSLSAVEVDRAGRVAGTIANLDFDTTFEGFPEFTLGVNGSSGNIIFETGELDLSTTLNLLSNSDGLIISRATSEIVDANGVAFAFNESDLLSKTATIVIDYGLGRASERYQISTVGDADLLSITADKALRDILAIPYQVDTNNLLQIRDIAAPANDSDTYWMAIHVTGTSIGSSSTVYDVDGINPNSAGVTSYEVMNDAALQNLVLNAGDIFHLIYIKDADHDGLGERAEQFNGTNPAAADTDNDGLDDKAEIDGWDVTLSSVGEMIYNTVGYGKASFWPAAPNAAHRAFDGEIDEIRLWDVTRSAAQVVASKDAPVSAPQAGLIGYWPMDVYSTNPAELANSPWSNADAVLIDASLNNNDMYLRNITDVVVQTVVAPAGFGNAFSLDGADDNLTLPERLISSQQTMTLEMRFKTSGNGVLFAYQNPGDNNYVPALYVGSDGLLRGLFWNGPGSSIMQSSVVVNDDNWHHAALVYDDSLQLQKLYLDGVEQGTRTGAVDFLGETVIFQVTSDPLEKDADADGLEDLAEFTAATNPTDSDTDGDLLQDLIDINPTIKENIAISLSGTVPTITTDEFTTINWGIPVLPVSVSDYRVLILEQQVDIAGGAARQGLSALPADNTILQVGDKLSCTDGSSCWEVIYSDSAASASSGNYNVGPRSVPADNISREYIALIRINGSWSLSEDTHSAFTGATDRLTIKFIAVDNAKCKDHSDDFICERAWQMNVDGVDTLVRPDNQYIPGGANTTLTDGLNQLSSTFSFDKPAIPGSCLTLRTRLSEVDGGTVYARYESHTLCYDDGWGSADDFSTVSDTLGIVSGVTTTAGSVGNAGYQGSYTYVTPEAYMYGSAAGAAAGNTVASARARYQITITPAP